MMKTSAFLLMMATVLAAANGHRKCYTPERTLNLLEKAMCGRCSATSGCHEGKTPLVAFSSRTSKRFTSRSSGAVIPFNVIVTNAGGSFHNGVFKCPVTGMYHFSWTIFTPPNKYADTQLRVNGHIKSYCNNNNNGGRSYSSTGCSIILQLNKGDRVYITNHNSNCYIGSLWSHFQGWLMRAT